MSAYSTGTYGVYVRNVSWDCTVYGTFHASHGPTYGIVWTDSTYTYSGTGTLVPRGPYEGTEQDSVDEREGRWQFFRMA